MSSEDPNVMVTNIPNTVVANHRRRRNHSEFFVKNLDKTNDEGQWLNSTGIKFYVHKKGKTTHYEYSSLFFWKPSELGVTM